MTGPRGIGDFGEQVVGLRRGETGEGTSTFLLDIEARHMNPHGVVHGGVTYTMVDNGMGAAVVSTLDVTELCATIEIKIVYLAPIFGGTLECVSTVINRGKRVVTLESEVRNDGKLVAKALGTYAMFPRKT
ncbi:MAG: PaaI family thioesterase [Dehalococcoidia bacterium]